jgi:hypothetical protein
MADIIFPDFDKFPTSLKNVLRPFVNCKYNWKLFWVLLSITCVLAIIAIAMLVAQNKRIQETSSVWPRLVFLISCIMIFVTILVPLSNVNYCREDRELYQLAIQHVNDLNIDFKDKGFFRRVAFEFRTLDLQRRMRREIRRSRHRHRSRFMS